MTFRREPKHAMGLRTVERIDVEDPCIAEVAVIWGDADERPGVESIELRLHPGAQSEERHE